MPEWSLDWEHPFAGNLDATIVRIADFNALGMRRVFGRSDYLRRKFNLDIWRTSKGRLLARFWSHSDDVDSESWEIEGILGVTQFDSNSFDGKWIPNNLRQEYNIWCNSNS